ncbi:hypothetical protein BKA65DRAFT_473527 [Rhexocercosporidium sp. MPI-PUGE-AT-0058]|nr:hypothetical protein BKA65DRAFT_473527 [Rhexocercosporidium sp. MPI-PUGE-AT-0058]
MAPQCTRTSPRRSPRTPKTPALLTASSLSRETNFRPRKIRITRDIRLANKAAKHKACKADSAFNRTSGTTKQGSTLPRDKGIVGKSATTLNSRVFFPRRRPRITRAHRFASEAAARKWQPSAHAEQAELNLPDAKSSEVEEPVIRSRSAEAEHERDENRVTTKGEVFSQGLVYGCDLTDASNASQGSLSKQQHHNSVGPYSGEEQIERGRRISRNSQSGGCK